MYRHHKGSCTGLRTEDWTFVPSYRPPYRKSISAVEETKNSPFNFASFTSCLCTNVSLPIRLKPKAKAKLPIWCFPAKPPEVRLAKRGKEMFRQLYLHSIWWLACIVADRLISFHLPSGSSFMSDIDLPCSSISSFHHVDFATSMIPPRCVRRPVGSSVSVREGSFARVKHGLQAPRSNAPSHRRSRPWTKPCPA